MGIFVKSKTMFFVQYHPLSRLVDAAPEWPTT